jgi:hypothetical protein
MGWEDEWLWAPVYLLAPMADAELGEEHGFENIEREDPSL